MFGLQRNRMTAIGRSIQRVMKIEGVVLPAFIHNGDYIDQLGSFIVDSEDWTITPADLLLETADLFAELSGQLTSSQKCRACYDAFLAAPTVANREVLREAYEAVPEHKRMYLGDMDTKDVPIRMIIYGKQELENWSHRIVARELGVSPLPTISVPDVLPVGGETPEN